MPSSLRPSAATPTPAPDLSPPRVRGFGIRCCVQVDLAPVGPHEQQQATSSAPAPKYRKQEQEPARPEVTEVAPGILRMQLPIHLPGLGHVNCYALEDDRGFAVVDPGMPGPRA